MGYINYTWQFFQNNILDKYFNTSSKEVIIISAIDNNVMELLSSCDFDKNCRLA